MNNSISKTPLLIVGSYKGATGYDSITREFTKELSRKDFDIRLFEVPDISTPLPLPQQDPVVNALARQNQSLIPGTALQFLTPVFTKIVEDHRSINFTMFEADRIPPDWVERARQHELIILPNEYGRSIWAESGVPEEKLKICPLAVDEKFFASHCQTLDIQISEERKFADFSKRFLSIADLRPRKNHIGLIRTWLNATSKRDDAVLLIKMSSNPERLNIFKQDFQRTLKESGKSLSNAAPIFLVSAEYSSNEMRSLYHSATHYISVSRGEGWDLPMMEAACAGLQLIAPDHSGYSEYVKPEDFYVLPSNRVPISEQDFRGLGDYALFKGLNWWEVEEESTVNLIADIINDRVPPKSKPQKRIMSDYNWEKSGNILADILKGFTQTEA